MIYLTLIILSILLFIALFLSNWDFIDPFFVTVSVFIISILFVLINKGQWDVEISPITSLSIILAIVLFGIGRILASLIIGTKRTYFCYDEIKINRYVFVLFYAISVMVLICYYNEILRISSIYNQSGDGLMIQYARLGMLHFDEKLNPTISIMSFFTRSMAYLFLFIFLYNHLLCGARARLLDLHYFIPAILYLIQYTLSGSRGAYIEFISFFLFLFYFFDSSNRGKSLYRNLKFLKVCAVSFLLFLVFFVYIGSFKGHGVPDMIPFVSNYAGGSILALNSYLENYPLNSKIDTFETFIGLNNILYRIGIYEFKSDRILEFVELPFSSISTNVYTSLRRYINDFGFFGMAFLQLFFGLLFGVCYNYIRSKRVNYVTLLYSVSFMMVVYQSIDDQIYVTFLSTTQIFTIFFTYFLYVLLVKRKINKSVRVLGR